MRIKTHRCLVSMKDLEDNWYSKGLSRKARQATFTLRGSQERLGRLLPFQGTLKKYQKDYFYSKGLSGNMSNTTATLNDSQESQENYSTSTLRDSQEAPGRLLPLLGSLKRDQEDYCHHIGLSRKTWKTTVSIKT